MKIESVRAVITGGAGGIGSAIAAELLAFGASVLLVDRDAPALEAARAAFPSGGDRADTLVADLTDAAGREALVAAAREWRGGANVLVNNAGLNHFGLFESQPEAQINAAIALNVEAPIQLCRAMLPELQRRGRAAIVNIGSVFGAIGYPGYVTYSATKFALRGFTEALRRELAGGTVSVHYLAPRATRTKINSSQVEKMNRELGVAMDEPRRVAAGVVSLLAAEEPWAVVGWPEKLFVRINGALPGLVDRALRRQLPVIRRYASAGPAAATIPATTDSRISS